MSYLTLDADRLVRDAVDAYLEGRLRPASGGDCVYATRNSQYRVVEGEVQEASDTSLIGAELVGWLVEELGQPLIEPRWRPYARAIFVERRSRHVVVTSRTLTRNTISGDVPPVPQLRRIPSVIPPSPPIPVLKSSSPPPAMEGSPTPFRVSASLRDQALALEARSPVPALVALEEPPPESGRALAPDPRLARDAEAQERPTARPPSDEATVAADRSSYEELLEQSRTPSWSGDARDLGRAAIPKAPPVPPPAPTRPVVLPPPAPTRVGDSRAAAGREALPSDSDEESGDDLLLEMDEEEQR